MLLGVETNGWIKEEDNVTVTLGSFTGTVTFYPQASSGFFLKAGAGASYVSTDFREGSLSVSVNKARWGILAGLGELFHGPPDLESRLAGGETSSGGKMME